MSSSAVIAARKRIEANLRSFSLPLSSEPAADDDEGAKTGSLLLSLLQSRLNWLNSVFIKYRPDPIQQPRRAVNSRRKWPNMRFLGTCTVELGPHSFPETSFYEAIRMESWSAIAEAVDPGALMAETGDGSTGNQNEDAKKADLIFSDIVMEFKEVPGERVLFPKDMIFQVRSTQTATEVLGSFLLPIDPAVADDFFLEPKEKVVLWGSQSNIARICQMSTTFDSNPVSSLPTEEIIYQPANIRLCQVEQALSDAIISTVHSSDIVSEQMKAKLKTVPKRDFLQFSKADKTIEELVQKACTVPDIASGPVQAEKKRNEILNAIRLGKRSRSDLSEEPTPKGKNANCREDGFRKCHYCSSKSTSMWRAGPEGAGTLCNGCGLLWSQDMILKDAPIISKEEEKRKIREHREKEREQREEEEWGRETQRPKKEASRLPKSAAIAVPKSTPRTASQSCQQQQQRLQNKASVLVPIAPHPTPPLPYAAQDPLPSAPAVRSTMPISHLKEKSTPSPLYNSTLGIPLPTLSIEFGPHTTFVHPNCSVTLKNACFSVKLVKDEHPAVTVNIAKSDLKNAKFEVTQDDGVDMHKAVLILTVDAAEEGPTVRVFDTDLLTPSDKTRQMVIRFLEKRDMDGDGIVKRILETWLETPIVSENASGAAGDLK